MPPRSVIQIVAGLPPLIDGVGDYALKLADALATDHSIRSSFVACRLNWSGLSTVNGFPVVKLERHSEQCFSRTLHSATAGSCQENTGISLLLHLSSYGYQSQGLPLWLLRGLHRFLRETTQDVHLVTMFHELYASGYPWRKAFWLSPAQRWLTAQFVKSSTAAVTNMSLYARRIERWDMTKRGRVSVLPVFSTIGEPTAPEPLGRRRPRLVVFGQAASRERLYTRSDQSLASVCEALGINEIHDVGPPLVRKLSGVGGAVMVKRGILPAAVINDLLKDAVGGFLDYPLDFLGKSTIFAAYCSHGLLPIVFTPPRQSLDGVCPGTNVWTIGDSRHAALDLEVAQDIASSAHAWYMNHRLSLQAALFASVLVPVAAGTPISPICDASV